MMKTGENNLRNASLFQTVEFTGQEDQNSVRIHSSNVTVIPSSGGHNHGSSNIILKNVVDFTWEHRYYTGQLLAIHMSGRYLAYGIKISGNTGPAVRVVNKQTEQRKLLKGMRVAIQDLAFAHVPNVILACVDYTGSLFVHTIEDTPNELICTRILQVDCDDSSPTSHRVIWCPYIPEDDQSSDVDEDVSKLLILTRGSQAELWSVAAASKLWPNHSIKTSDEEVKESGVMMEIIQHSGTIVEAAFSPDGTALAMASVDGEIQFFKLHHIPSSSNKGGVQKLGSIHQWKPHDGRPISCLYFLDDYKTCQPEEKFWRFALTGCDNNTEIKIWSCETWRCLQTIKLTPAPSSSKPLVLKANIDFSASYFILSDIYNKILYIFSLTKENDESFASVTTISELLLPYPILSFAIVDAGQRKVRTTGEFLDDLCTVDDESEEEEHLIIKMYLVQPKSLQECNISFRPAMQVTMNANDSLEYTSNIDHNGLAGENGESNHQGEANHSSGLNLMTPDAFSSPAKKENNNLDSPQSPELSNNSHQRLDTEPTSLNIIPIEEQAPPSGGSSPSREVREILSLGAQLEELVTAKQKSDSVKSTQEKWSDIPIVLLKDVHVQEQNEIVHVSAENNSDEPQIQQQQSQREKSSTTGIEMESKWAITNDNIFTLRNKIDSLFQIIKEQRQEVNELRLEVSRLRNETINMNQVENTIARVLQQHNTNLEKTLYNHLTRQRDYLATFETTIKDKIETIIPCSIESNIESFKQQLRMDVCRIDELVRENLKKVMSSAHIRDSLAFAAANAVTGPVDTAFKENFSNNVLPALEKTCENMFKQIEDSFVRGTKQYLQNADNFIEKRYQRRNEQQHEQFSTLVRKEMQSELSKGFSGMQESMTRTVRDTVRDTFNKHMSDLNSIRSRANTPSISVTSSADTQSRVLSLLQRGQLEAAFQQALSASDLNLVVLVCEKTDPASVFSCPSSDGSRCILAQPVILSLVQQLSADFTDRPQLKHKWLEEAILNLDPNNPVTREHMGNVLMPMQNQLAAFLNANPNHKYARRMKMLAMAARALLSQNA